MTIIVEKTEALGGNSSRKFLTYRQAQEYKQETVWQSLAHICLEDAKEDWLSTIQNPCTKKSYQTAMRQLIEHRLINPNWSLQEFSLLSANIIIDRIKSASLFVAQNRRGRNPSQWSTRTREARISCFLSFTRYLSRKTEGVIRRGIPCKEGIEKTFSPKNKKVKTKALTRSQILLFFDELDKINARDAMIARLCLHGAKRISEVLNLHTDKIDYEKKQICFEQSKSKFSEDFTLISFEKDAARIFLEKLSQYIGERKGFVFVSATGKKIQKTQVDRNFAKAGARAKIPFRVSPHNLRATAITLWKEDGFSDSLIMHATGHASSEMVHAYDKSDIAENVTKRSCLL